MVERSHLLIVAIAVLGAGLGLVAGQWFEHGQATAPNLALPAGMHVLQPGDRRLDLDLSDSGGRMHRLSEWDGKLLLINFWATWCGPCREEMPLLDSTRTRFAAQQLEVLGIAIDDADSVRAFLRQSPVRYPILLADAQQQDPSLLFGDTRAVLPYSVLIGSDGRILAQRAGNFSEQALLDWLQPHLLP